MSGLSSLLSSLCISNSFHPTKSPIHTRSMLGAVTLHSSYGTHPVQGRAAVPSPTSASRAAPQDTSSFLPVHTFWFLLEWTKLSQIRGGTECRPVPPQHTTARHARHTRDWKNTTEYPLLFQHSTRYLKNKGVLNF